MFLIILLLLSLLVPIFVVALIFSIKIKPHNLNVAKSLISWVAFVICCVFVCFVVAPIFASLYASEFFVFIGTSLLSVITLIWCFLIRNKIKRPTMIPIGFLVFHGSVLYWRIELLYDSFYTSTLYTVDVVANIVFIVFDLIMLPAIVQKTKAKNRNTIQKQMPKTPLDLKAEKAGMPTPQYILYNTPFSCLEMLRKNPEEGKKCITMLYNNNSLDEDIYKYLVKRY